MSGVGGTILSILIIMVILGVLVSIHEAGHLLVAKLFNIYCFEYSIGFGPKILKKKRKAGETFFSIGVIPFGGYVAMYGESEAVPDGVEVPPMERSIEGVAKWKKALVLVAGVTLNFILGLILIFVSVSCFPQYYSMYGAYVATSAETAASVNYVKPTYDGEVKSFIETKLESGYTINDVVLSLPSTSSDTSQSQYIVSDMAVLYKQDGTYYNGSFELSHYIATFNPSDNISAHDLSTSITFYFCNRMADEYESSVGLNYSFFHKTKDYEGMTEEEIKVVSPVAFQSKNLEDGAYFAISPYLVQANSDDLSDVLPYTERYLNHKIDFTANEIKLVASSGAFKATGVNMPVIKAWNNWNQIWSKFANRVPTACGAIVKGFASLFTPGGWNNVSGIIGMTAAVPGIVNSGGAAMVFWYAAVISINLAFFNLLPFPGLDGWGLVVTAFEAITRKKISSKVKGIVSAVGLFLLFGLMIAIVIKDIIGLI